MHRVKSFYSCQSCGYQSPKWLGRCPSCLSWNTLVEEREEKTGHLSIVNSQPPLPLEDLSREEKERIRTGIGEFDRVLGGGIVPGGVVLIGGDPGIGKSTLLMQAMDAVASRGGRVLYVSGEESQNQIRMRAERLSIRSKGFYVYTENLLEAILEEVRGLSPSILAIDSIQTIYTEKLSSTPGSIAQLREATARLIDLTKRLDIPLFLIGHVTKEGVIAGPKVLEHMVDTVLYFEGDRGYPYRILRASKNRFGSINEIGVFEMAERGLKEVKNPSSIFLSDRPEEASGSAVVASMEGTRPILVEVQALVSGSFFGVPARTVLGLDPKKVSLIVAVLEKKAELRVGSHDIFLKVSGGIKVDEPAVDLGIAGAIASNFMDRAIPPDTVVFGELGLTGEVRGVSQSEMRVREARKLGFKRCICPAETGRGLKEEGIEIIGVRNVKEFLHVLF